MSIIEKFDINADALYAIYMAGYEVGKKGLEPLNKDRFVKLHKAISTYLNNQ